jgi:predicted RNA methylase
MTEVSIIQPDLFGDVNVKGIHIDDAAQQVGVSTATIRNWIKTGYLKKDINGLIDEISYAQFVDNIIGFEKLNSRANKSQKDSHDHEKLVFEIGGKISKDSLFYDSIGSEYEDNLSDSYRNKEGIYYTPQSIVNDMLPLGIKDIENKIFCDPSCGSGNFIIRAIEIGFKPENVYGFDIDPIAIAITKKRILEKTGYNSDKIIETDFLSYIKNKTIKFDYIYTNPPWGKKIQKSEKKMYAAIFSTGKSIDTSALFFFASLYCLNENGSLGFLLPEAFFNIATFENARLKALDLSIDRLVDYGKSFKGLLTKAQAIVLTNRKSENHDIQCKIEKKEYARSTHSFKKIPKSILNFHCNNEDSKVIEHVYLIPHITLIDKAKWGLGIVTGNNNKFGEDLLAKGLMPVFKGSDITYDGLKTPSLFIPKDLSLYQQVAPKELYESSEKLIYKFISSKLCFYCDSEQRYILNSANMIVPQDNLHISCRQLGDFFNSRFVNWLFKSIFNTHKILRGDLEALPVHFDFFKKHTTFNEKKYLEFIGIEEDKDGTYRVKR